ncbi:MULTISPECIES: sigma-70 family RNA polymerase sigma factor [Pseudanabaena]|uniref:RNA polymerase, sigma-24 subunit, ECF subfamily n=2 Tax=Pseudanabaena TaxID=1152 RepID=L8MTQ1_9CYAN|nr:MULTISPECIES: sigma-70 family RNA polymerase sigma factor [Pseudanabaena]ELS30174.1 RNA polymerase, sigma-24 subunit, ECF subfamily [Pseudanabaena biceps PCC 7429]MDG3497535.1 sigma-70 family RNA polymerase sigma factor [Pseudanabaena catenata USMAC16]
MDSCDRKFLKVDTASRQDEISLISRIAEQDQTALSLLYDRYSRIIYTIAYRILNSAEESEEIVLDVFTQVWRIAKNYNSQKARVDTWLFMLTRSRALDRLRSYARLDKAVAISEDAIMMQPHTDSPEEDVLIRERRSYVVACLSEIPDEQRLVLELAYFGGLSHSEISTKTGISLGTVKTRIRLGLKKLRELIGEEWSSF